MPAYATQSAPKQAQGNPQQQKQPKQEAPKGLAALPQGAGVAALVVMLALALPIGNFRALQNATPQAFIRQGDVKSIVEDRISAAQNAVTVAQRGSVSQTTLDDVSSAIKAMQSAKTARDISRADQQLTVAVSQLVDDANLPSAEDERQNQLSKYFAFDFFSRCDEIWVVNEESRSFLYERGFEGNIEVFDNGTELEEADRETRQRAREAFTLWPRNALRSRMVRLPTRLGSPTSGFGSIRDCAWPASGFPASTATRSTSCAPAPCATRRPRI